MKYKIHDTVKLIGTNRISQVIRTTYYETHEIVDGEIKVKTDERYNLDGHMRVYTPDQLELIENNFETYEAVERLIIDINLKERNFEFLKNYLGGENNDK